MTATRLLLLSVFDEVTDNPGTSAQPYYLAEEIRTASSSSCSVYFLFSTIESAQEQTEWRNDRLQNVQQKCIRKQDWLEAVLPNAPANTWYA